MKNFLLIFVLSFLVISCSNDVTSDNGEGASSSNISDFDYRGHIYSDNDGRYVKFDSDGNATVLPNKDTTEEKYPADKIKKIGDRKYQFDDPYVDPIKGIDWEYTFTFGSDYKGLKLVFGNKDQFVHLSLKI